jgi:fructokinase
VGIGEVLWDLLPTGRQLGGAPTNFAYHAQALGLRGRVVSAVGTDTPGQDILGRLDALGLDRSLVHQDAEHPTGTVDVTLDGEGLPSYVIHADVAWDFIPQTSQLLEQARDVTVVCYGTLAQRSPVSRATIQAFIQNTPADALRIFDVNLRQNYYSAETLRALLSLSNVVKLNEGELPIVTELLGIQERGVEALQCLVSRFKLRLAALTRGAQGSVLVTPAQVSEHPGLKATIVDTVGAGDAFTAAVAVGFLARHGLDEINDAANHLAAYICSQNGATPTVPDELRGRVLDGP